MRLKHKAFASETLKLKKKKKIEKLYSITEYTSIHLYILRKIILKNNCYVYKVSNKYYKLVILTTLIVAVLVLMLVRVSPVFLYQ